MAFSEIIARRLAAQHCTDQGEEQGLVESFVQVCGFLHENPDRLSRQSQTVEASEGLSLLAASYYAAYRRSDIPVSPGTVPDDMVSIIMMESFGYSKESIDQIKVAHQKAMAAENCVGALLERYLDSVLRRGGWHWCCGSFVKAVDFIRRDHDGRWLSLQIKNRDNSENSSSSAIRSGTAIQKWFRSFSRTGKTNWEHLPPFGGRFLHCRIG